MDELIPASDDELIKALAKSSMEDNDLLSAFLREVIVTARNAKKLGVEKQARIIATLTKAHSELVRTSRAISGADDSSRNLINQGVIIIPGKSENWVEDAQAEIASAKKLVEAQVKSDAHSPKAQKEEGEAGAPPS